MADPGLRISRSETPSIPPRRRFARPRSLSIIWLTEPIPSKSSVGTLLEIGKTNPPLSKTWTVQSAEPRLIINEVLAKNFVTRNHDGSFPDLIELHNAGGVAMDLSGYSISDDVSLPRKFVFSAEVTITPGSYFVLYADDAVTQPGIHLGFALRQGGDGVFLFDEQGQLVDSVAFGTQIRDLSIGRVGHDEQWQLTVPTFGAANILQPVGDPSSLRINEWFASGSATVGADFVELFNPEPLPVNLAGLFLSDEPAGNPQQNQIAPLSFIAAQGYVELVADGNRAAGPDHLNFRLSSDQEVLGTSSSGRHAVGSGSLLPPKQQTCRRVVHPTVHQAMLSSHCPRRGR